MNEHHAFIIHALKNMKGDNLARARAAFHGFTAEQLNKEYRASGKTCAQILQEYEAYEAKVDAALEWLKKVTGGTR